MRNKKWVISDFTTNFIKRMFKEQTGNGVVENIDNNLIDSTLDGVRDILKITLYSQIENELEKQHEEY